MPTPALSPTPLFRGFVGFLHPSVLPFLQQTKHGTIAHLGVTESTTPSWPLEMRPAGARIRWMYHKFRPIFKGHSSSRIGHDLVLTARRSPSESPPECAFSRSRRKPFCLALRALAAPVVQWKTFSSVADPLSKNRAQSQRKTLGRARWQGMKGGLIESRLRNKRGTGDTYRARRVGQCAAITLPQ